MYCEWQTDNTNQTLYYKGYIGTIGISFCNQYYGKVLNSGSLLMFEGDTLEELIKNFHSVVDDHISHLLGLKND